MGYANVIYDGHVQNIGDVGPFKNGELCGTTGKGLRLEGIYVKLETDEDLGLELQGHIQDVGWGPVVKDGELCGTVDQSKRLEAIKIKLTGSAADKYSVIYGVHVQNVGDMQTAMDGESAGTEGYSERIEAIQIWVVEKGVDFKVETLDSFRKAEPAPAPSPVPVASAQGKKSGKIYLAVGHGVSSDGSWDCGCVDGQYTEADLMLAIGKVAAARLRDLGFTVLTDADTDNDKNIAVCVPEANNWGADVYVSLHCDYNAAPSGTLPIVYPGSDDGIRLANCLISSAQARNGLGTRGIIQRDDWEVSDTNMTACIFETGSIREDIGVLTNAAAYGEAVAQGIYDWF